MARARECYGFGFGAPGILLLACWLCLAPAAARADQIGFNTQNTGSSTLDWSDPNNWWSSSAVPGAVPGAGDDVYLETSGASITNMNFNTTVSLSSLTVDQQGGSMVLNVIGGSLTMGTLTLGEGGIGSIVQTGGSVSVPAVPGSGFMATGNVFMGSNPGSTGSYALSGGSLGLSNVQMWNNSSIAVTGGTLTTSDGAIFSFGPNTSILNSGNGQVSNNAWILSNGGATIANTNGGAFSNNSGGYITNDGSILNNLSGATFTNTDAGSVLYNQTSVTGTTGIGATLTNDASTFYNLAGAVLDNTGTHTVFYNQGGAKFYNDAQDQANYNALECGHYTCMLNNMAGATFYNTGANTVLNNQNGANLTNDGVGTHFYNDATINNNGGPNWSPSNQATIWNQNGATLANSGTISNTGMGAFANGGIFTVPTPIATVTNTGLFTNTGNGTRLFNDAYGTFDNTGSSAKLYNGNEAMIWNEASGGEVGANANLINESGASLVNDGRGSLLRNDWGATLTNSDPGTRLLNENGATLTNDSSSASGTTLVNKNGATLTNTGLDTSGASPWASSINNVGGAILTNTGVNMTGATPVASTLMNENGGMIVNDASKLNNQAGAILTNTGVNTAGASPVASTLFNQDGGTIVNDASTLNNLAGAILLNTDPGTTLYNQDGGTIYNDALSVLNNANGALLSNGTGAMLHNDGTLNNSATVDDSGTIDTPGGTGIYSQTAGLTTVEAGGSFTQASLNISGGDFTDYGSVLITGNATNTGSVTIDGATAIMTVEGNYIQFAATAVTKLNGGTLDPPAIQISGGTFGGSGTVEGSLTLSNDSTLQVGNAAGDQLTIDGAYSQTGGELVFDIRPNGSGGFTESTLNLSGAVDIGSANILFDFVGGATLADLSGFNIDSFFTGSGGANLLANLGADFAGDSFTYEDGTHSQPTAMIFHPADGSLSGASVPEPGTLLLPLPGLAILASLIRRRRGGR